MEQKGIGGLVFPMADIYAIAMILQSSAKSIEKLIWSLVVFLLPLIGLIIWYFAGPHSEWDETIRAKLAGQWQIVTDITRTPEQSGVCL